MINSHSFYRLSPATMDGCDLTKAARMEAADTWLCPGCTSPKPGIGAIDVQIQQSKIKDGPLNSTGLEGLAFKPFLEQLGQDVVERDLFLGRAFGPDGEELENWCTYRSRRDIIVRGSDNPDDENSRASYRICRECGRTLYFAFGIQHLYPAPPSDAEVFVDYTSLVIPGYLFARLEIPRNAKIDIDRLEVLDAPLDGFGVLEPWESDRSKWGVKHRSMRGHTRLSDSVLRQGQEDLNARKNGYYTDIIWHFFPDPKTGRLELSPDLVETMEECGIQYVRHE